MVGKRVLIPGRFHHLSDPPPSNTLWTYPWVTASPLLADPRGSTCSSWYRPTNPSDDVGDGHRGPSQRGEDVQRQSSTVCQHWPLPWLMDAAPPLSSLQTLPHAAGCRGAAHRRWTGSAVGPSIPPGWSYYRTCYGLASRISLRASPRVEAPTPRPLPQTSSEPPPARLGFSYTTTRQPLRG